MTSQTGAKSASGSSKILTITTEIILLDVRGYSKKSNVEQLEIVKTLTDRLRQMVALLTATGSMHVPELAEDALIVGYVPTGDGAYVILNPLYGGYGILLGLALRNDLVRINKTLGGALYEGIRVAVHLGQCLTYMDITNRVNFAGQGMNDCARILQARCSPNFPMGFTDEDFVVVSSEALACLDDLYYSKTNHKQRQLMKHRRSEPFVVKDKHGCEHPVQLIEMHRNIALQPFKPVVALTAQKKNLMREIAANRLPEPSLLDSSGIGLVGDGATTEGEAEAVQPDRRERSKSGSAEE